MLKEQIIDLGESDICYSFVQGDDKISIVADPRGGFELMYTNKDFPSSVTRSQAHNGIMTYHRI